MTQSANNKSVISSTPKDIGNPQVNWDRKKFDDLITDKGYECYIERALKCPCSNIPTGAGLSDCQNCYGTGWFFIDKQKSTIVCTSMSHRTKYEVWSQANSGIVNISTRPQDKLGFMDKVTLTELESWFSQTYELKKSIRTNSEYFSFLIYNPINVFDVYLYKDSISPLIYVNNGDYIIDANKIIFKKDFIENLDISNPTITIRFTHNPTYHIIDVNRDMIKQKSLSDTGIVQANFPLSCIGKRAHFMYENPNFGGENVYDNTNYSKKPTIYDY